MGREVGHVVDAGLMDLLSDVTTYIFADSVSER